MASWDGAEQGAMAAAPTGNPWLIAAGALLGGLFGRREQYTPAQKQQMRIANQMEQFGNSVPLSDPQEQAALAESRGMLGESQRQDMGTLMSLGPNFASTGAGGAADQVRSMKAGQTGQSMALTTQALLNAIASRRRILMEAAQVAQGVGQPNRTPGLGMDLANLMRAYSQYKAMHSGGQTGSGNYGVTGATSGQGPGGYGTNVGLGGNYSVNLPPEFGGVSAQSIGPGNMPPVSSGLPTGNLGTSNSFQPPAGGAASNAVKGPGGNPFQQDFQTLFQQGPWNPMPRVGTPAKNPWQAGMNNYTNGMGAWPMNQPGIAAGYGIPSSNGTADQFLGSGGNIFSQLLQGISR